MGGGKRGGWVSTRVLAGLAALIITLAAMTAAAGAASGAASADPTSPDPGFGGTGVVQLSIDVAAMAMRPDGAVVVAGYASGGTDVVSLRPDGRPDTNFGTAGMTTLAQFFDVAAVALDSRGNSYFFGAAVAPGGAVDGAVVAVGPDGRVLSGFGTAGEAVTGCRTGGSLTTGSLGTAGQIFAAGVCGGIAMTAKFDADGVRDPGFGAFGNPDFEFTSTLARPDGSVLFAGRSSVYGAGEVWGFSSDGSLLAGFVTATLPGVGPPRLLGAPNGEVYAANGGTNGGCCAAPFIVTRLHPDGTVDTGYGQGTGSGSVYLDGPGYFDDAAVQPDGAVVMVGVQTGTDPVQGTVQIVDAAVARLDPGGNVDSGFAPLGWVHLGAFRPAAVAVDSAGRPVIAAAGGSSGGLVERLKGGALPPPVRCDAFRILPSTGVPVSLTAMRTLSGCGGYWAVTNAGAVGDFGAAAPHGDLAGVHLNAPIVGISATPDGGGYWLLGADGGIFAFGDAHFYGSTGNLRLASPVVALAPTSSGGGYWLVAKDGGVFTFGDARFHGSLGGIPLTQPVDGLAATPSGAGYWLVASDGGVFSFGDAPFLGSTGNIALNKPVVGLTADPAGRGYRMVASDGGIFSFGAPFYGSLGANPPASPIVAMAPSVDGNGYYLMSSNGQIWAFGDAVNLGNA